MTTLQIDSNDKNSIKKLLDIAINKFHLKIKILDDVKSVGAKTKWAKFAEKMDGLFTPEIVKSIHDNREEARENFVPKG